LDGFRNSSKSLVASTSSPNVGIKAVKDRVVTAEEVVAREPDLIIGSWCGKKFRPERVVARAGFDRLPAVQHQDLYEIKSSLILQPGPAALTDGLAELEKIIRRWPGLLA
jgi:iron complex transport system substrate-binding protein